LINSGNIENELSPSFKNSEGVGRARARSNEYKKKMMDGGPMRG
jgi:hypothetical protein